MSLNQNLRSWKIVKFKKSHTEQSYDIGANDVGNDSVQKEFLHFVG